LDRRQDVAAMQTVDHRHDAPNNVIDMREVKRVRSSINHQRRTAQR
jgi:hypothetical protein